MKEKYSNYWRWAVTTVCTVSVCLVIFFLMFRYRDLINLLKKLGDILLPVIIGAVIAYFINPVVNFLDQHLLRFFLRIKLPLQRAEQFSLCVSIFLSLSLFVFGVFSIISLILPELYKSISNFVSNFEGYVTTITTWFSNLEILKKYPELYDGLSDTLDKLLDSVGEWVSTSLLGSLSDILSGLTLRIIGIFNVLLDIFVGLIVSIYILFGKRKYTAKSKRMMYVLFKPETANTILHMASKSNQIFSGFISGKLLDSLIIGMMCFLGMTFFKMPYIVLISIIIGVTNIIPFFGPFIGAIPSAILVLLADPTNLKQVVLFVFFIFCLQQFDGNILGPKILGDSTGTSALMVIISILIGGGLFGFMGMFLGVPTFAVLNYLLRCFIHYRLRKKGLPEGHINFYDLTAIDDSAGEMLYYVPGTNTVTGEPLTFTRQLNRSSVNTTFSDSVKEDSATFLKKDTAPKKNPKNKTQNQKKKTQATKNQKQTQKEQKQTPEEHTPE